ncbi:histone promoter control 2 hpc2 [Trichoderma arundinaceum]|uniref:Histone promoter control 2 hpc2 n=1 Tax=Trichoderma arundinaceum TaxID=490622 RepID=A0A395NFL7_TRIAR|nr:histone promoter control 2 hpc2 [Trichoderma arundinaceum]
MAAAGDASTTRFDSSAGELSSPPSGSLSEPGSPSHGAARHPNVATDRSALDMEEIVVSGDQNSQQQYSQQYPPQPPAGASPGATPGSRNQTPKRYSLIDGEWVQLTAAGVPRKKPGRKPGSVVKPKNPTEGPEQPKVRKPRKSREAEAPPVQRKRKLAPASDVDTDAPSPRPLAPAGPGGPTSSSPSLHPQLGESLTSTPQHQFQQLPDRRYSPKMQKREGYPSSMQSILNADPPPVTRSPSNSIASPSTSIPVRTSGQSYDPIRGNYDPVRETMTSHYSSAAGSPRAPLPVQSSHRSPSIASMLEPQPSTKASPIQSHLAYPPAMSQPRLQAQDATPLPPSPSYLPKTSTPTPANQTPALKPPVHEIKRDAPTPTPPAPRPVVDHSNFTTIANGPIKKVSPKQKPITSVSTPKTDNLEETIMDMDERSILDFGRARPGEEKETPTIVLSIPITAGETNKYVNFMRMAEDQYGWDALHPRLAANRDRKARIAAAAASLEKVESGRESGDEMSVDLSDGEGSNPDNGGVSGADAQAKPKKKRNFKEDQYDVDDDFVDDSELLWEAQAAASRDGFFVYSGPLVPEVEKPAAGHEERPKRGRGGRGSRGGGRGGAARGGAAAGRGGGPGSRGGSVARKPRITKSEKAQREREKAERESIAKASANGYPLQPTTPSLSVRELGS